MVGEGYFLGIGCCELSASFGIAFVSAVGQRKNNGECDPTATFTFLDRKLGDVGLEVRHCNF